MSQPGTSALEQKILRRRVTRIIQVGLDRAVIKKAGGDLKNCYVFVSVGSLLKARLYGALLGLTLIGYPLIMCSAVPPVVMCVVIDGFDKQLVVALQTALKQVCLHKTLATGFGTVKDAPKWGVEVFLVTPWCKHPLLLGS